MNIVQQEVDTLYKEHFGKMVASLLYSFRDLDLETVEDVVHDTFSSALTYWQQKGIPANTSGWLYKVCRNKALNKLKKNNRLVSLDEKTDQRSAEIGFNESVLDDPQLRLLFACANPDLSPKTQVVITLKYVVNLKVEAIAQVLGMTIDGVDKLLLRARQKIKGEKILLEEPHASALKQRRPIVHKIIYLTFNEGYKSSGSKEVLREDLCEEALLLNKGLIDSNLGNKDSLALQALMLFNSARFKSRFSSSDKLLDLENQDRTLWNKDLILLAEDFLTRSHSEALSNYHVEAAIAYKHCSAVSFKATEWETIAGLYKHLLHSNPNPFVELNYAIALYYAGEKQSAFKLLNELQQHAFFNQYYLLSMTLGKFYHLEGDDGLAKQYLLKAYDQTNNVKERDFIGRMMEGLE
ncbi:RNA polymerase sigma factor [Mucilaginibacter sp. OK098]|uniref:RNA polymerase sigma factor n=1 Tax=Mucilaginibacter sp. OK098 TaxID=1855297 RepID=UPI000915A18A|nr:sigma-70 family RNA polymerase sigma factor [Mucilaginibacter sp. OK098]SHM74915.1 RNA polymerase sigma-70 factor, ECF subfamily [Mucilaginibacter sp. OK098]